MPAACSDLPIVVAEDDPDDQMLVEHAARKAGLNNPLHFVANGVELFDYLNRRGKHTDRVGKPLPGLILLDLNMPKMNGREVLERRRAHDEFCQIPVVVLTTSCAEPEILATYRLGANSFVTKPSSAKSFVALMQSLGRYWFNLVTLPQA